MPQIDVEKLKQSNSVKTWEEAFEGVDKTSAKFDDLVDAFVKFVGDWKDFSDIRRDRLAEYILSLDNVQGHWKDVNKWIETNTDSLVPYVGTLRDIKSLFQSISQELGGNIRQIRDNENIIRGLSRLATDNIVAIQQEGGLTENSIRSLDKKKTKLEQEYKTRLTLLGVHENGDNLRIVAEGQEDNLRITQNRIAELNKLRESGIRLTSIQREELKNLQLRERLIQSNLELLNEYNRTAKDGLFKRIDLQQKYFKEISKELQTTKVDVASKLLKKLGMSGEAAELKESYGKHSTKRVEANTNLELAKQAEEVAKVNYDNAFKEKDTKLYQREKGQSEAVIAEAQRKFFESQQKVADLERQIEENQSRLKDFETTFKKDKNIKGYRNVITGRKATTEEVEQNNQDRAFEYKSTALKRVADKELIQSKNNLNKALSEHANRFGELIAKENALKEATENRVKAEKEVNNIKPYQLKVDLVNKIKTGFKSLLSPASLLSTIALVIWKNFLKVDEVASNLRQRIGSWEFAAAATNSQFATSTQWLEMAVGLADEFHIDPVLVFSNAEIGKMAEAKNLLGYTNKQAQNLGVSSKLVGISSDQFRKNMKEGWQNYVKTTGTAVHLGGVQREVLNTSNAIRLSYGGQGEALAKAAAAALEIGMSMQQVENVASNLISFESSISAEMQAQLLTGRQLNLAKAREYALNNDIKGVVGEIKKQGIDMNFWGNSNRIQQENMAKALGMSREELAQMVVTQELQNGASTTAIAKAMKISEESVKATALSMEWKTTVAKLSEAFTPILQILRPVVELISFAGQLISPFVGWISSLFGLLDKINDQTSTWIKNLARCVLILPLIGKGMGTIAVGAGKATASMAALPAMLVKPFKGLGTAVKDIKQDGALATLKKGWSSIGEKFKQGRESVTAPGQQKPGNLKKALQGTQVTEAAGRTSQRVTGTGNNLPKLGSNIRTFINRVGKAVGITTVGSVARVFASSGARMATGLRALNSVKDSTNLPILGQNIASFVKSFGTVKGLGKFAGISTIFALFGKPMAFGVRTLNTVSKFSDGLLKLGNNVKFFIDTFKTVTVKNIGAFIAAASSFAIFGVPMALGVASLNLASKFSDGLLKLGNNVLGFMVPFKTITAGSLAKLAAFGVAAAVAAPGILLLELVSPFAGLLPALGTAIASFGTALSTAAGPILIGSGVLAVLGASLIPVAFALRLVAPAFSAFGDVVVALGSAIKSAFEGIGSVITTAFSGMSALLENITFEKAAALGAVGVSFGALAAGMAAATVAIAAFPRKKFAKILETASEIKASDSTQLKSTEEKLGIPKENIKEAYSEVTIQRTQNLQKSQEISVNQKEADYSRIERKMDTIIKAIEGSRPDWNWLEFQRELRTNTVGA